MNVKTITSLAAAAILAAACAACSSAGTTASQQQGAPGIAAIEQAHGLTGCTPVTPPTLYATAEATCTDAQGSSVDLATFASNDLRDKWTAAASGFGPILWKGDRYAATAG